MVGKANNLFDELRFESAQHTRCYSKGLHPLAGFMKHLARPASNGSTVGDRAHAGKRSAQHTVQLWVPDTVVFEEGCTPTWYYTNDQGRLMLTHDFELADVQRRFQRKKEPKEVVAVMKQAMGFVRNSSSLVDTEKLGPLIGDLAAPSGTVALQRFVCSRQRAELFRCRWMRHPQSVEVFHLVAASTTDMKDKTSDELSLLVSVRHPDRIEIMPLLKGKLHAELSEIMIRVVAYLATYRGLHFEEFVCDFVCDETGRMWFLQVKAFLLYACRDKKQVVSPGVWSGTSYEQADRGRCGFCECTFRICDLQSGLTARQILKVYDRLRCCGLAVSWLPAARNGTARAGAFVSRDATTYELFSVCADCHALHCALEDFERAGAFFGVLSGALDGDGPRGIERDDDAGATVEPDAGFYSGYVWADTLHTARTMATRALPLQAESTHEHPPLPRSRSLPSFSQHPRARAEKMALLPAMPADWHCPLEPLSTQAVVLTKAPAPLLQFRLLLLFQMIAGDLGGLRGLLERPGARLALTWSLFGVTRCVALRRDIGSWLSAPFLPVNALGTQHVFVSSEGALDQWFHACPQLDINMIDVSSGARLGCASLDLRKVIQRRSELSLCTALLLGQFPTLRLVTAVGVDGGVAFGGDRVGQRTHAGGLIHTLPAGVLGPEPLPESWLRQLSIGSDSFLDLMCSLGDAGLVD